MKRIHYSFIAVLLFITYSCERNLTSEGVSKTTTYVVMTVTGDPFMSIAKGTPFTDPGVTAMEGDVSATVTTTGTVDSNTPGVYTLDYTAVNKEGYSVSESRIVCVYDPSAAANNFEGSYARSTNQSIAVWTKIAPGMYSVFNPGGAPGTNLTIHAFNATGNVIIVPTQKSSDGSITSCKNATGGSDIIYNPGPPAKYAWVVVNAGYGASTRTFIKQ